MFFKVKFFLTFALLFPSAGFAQFQDPQCRSFVLHGSVLPPEGAELPEGVELTVTYQMNYQKGPALLLVNEPLPTRYFELSFTNLRDLERPEKKLEKKVEQAGALIEVGETQPTETQAETQAETQPETQASEITSFRFYAPVMFLYPREIRFRYYIRVRSTGWVSELKALDFFHERKDVEGVVSCESDLNLPAVELPGTQSLEKN